MTKFHSKYKAHLLNLKSASGNINNLSRSIANARLDVNPYQIRAALAALKTPLSNGFILADEVGLGKTIEAGLVIAQTWMEGKKNILLILPAFLRKQWEQELFDKFSLPSKILDSKMLRKEIESGKENPFNDTDHIIICSYQFAVRNHFYFKLFRDRSIKSLCFNRGFLKNRNISNCIICIYRKGCKKIII